MQGSAGQLWQVGHVYVCVWGCKGGIQEHWDGFVGQGGVRSGASEALRVWGTAALLARWLGMLTGACYGCCDVLSNRAVGVSQGNGRVESVGSALA